LPEKYDREWVCPQAQIDAQNYLVVSVTGYSEDELERTSPEFIASILRGREGYQKAEKEQAGG